MIGLHYSVFGSDYINSSFFISMVVCAFLYYLTWQIVPNKPRAKFQVVAIIFVTVLLGPWWCALLGGLAGHLAGIYFVERWCNDKSGDRKYVAAVSMILVVQTVAGSWTTTQAHFKLEEIQRLGRAEKWSVIKASGDVGQFLEIHYRPCEINAVTECRRNTLEAAEKFGGKEFSARVNAEIDKIRKQPEFPEEFRKRFAETEIQYFPEKD